MFVTKKKFQLVVSAIVASQLSALLNLEELAESAEELRNDVDYLLEELEEYLD